MNRILKQLIIVSVIFALIYWFQYKEDKKKNINRTSYYDMFKGPTLVAAIVGFILNITNVIDVISISFDEKPTNIIEPITSKPELVSPNVLTGGLNVDEFTPSLNSQQIFTDLPDF